MKMRSTMIFGAALAVSIASFSPAYCEEQPKAATGESGLVEVLRLLEKKGVITKEESTGLENKFGRAPAEPEAAREMEEPREEARAPLSFADAMESLELMAEQALITFEEKTELRERLDDLFRKARGETPPERQKMNIGEAGMEYKRTTIPVEEIKDNLKFLAFQNVMTRKEAAAVFERYGKKHQTDWLIENAVNEMGREVDKDLEVRMKRVAELEKKAAKLPEWLNRFRLYGDLRLRYQADFFGEGNFPSLNKIDKPAEPLNTTIGRHRFRTRARLGLTARVNDEVEATIGLATGSASDPVSTNQTLGDGFNKKTILIDTAYLKWSPVKSFTAQGGRMPNPWFSTDLVWDRDLNFDGFAATYAPSLGSDAALFFTAGAFPLQEFEFFQHDKWLFGAQAGVSYKPADSMSMKLGAAYYHFINTQGKPNNVNDEFDYTAPSSVQKGNTYFDINNEFVLLGQKTSKFALAPEYRLLNVTAALDLGFWDPLHIMLMADYVLNLGYNAEEVNSLLPGPVKKENMGYQVGVAAGYPELKQFGDWKGFLNYRYLGADAVLDAFADSDFHLGGTNTKGWTLGTEFGLGKNTWLTGKWMTAGEISGEKMDIDVFQLDLNVKF